MLQGSNPGEQAPQADVLSIPPWTLREWDSQLFLSAHCRIRLVPRSLLVLGWLRDIISWSYLASVEFVGLSVLGHFRQHRRWDVLVRKLLKLIYWLPKCLGLGNQWWLCCRPGSCDMVFLCSYQSPQPFRGCGGSLVASIPCIIFLPGWC